MSPGKKTAAKKSYWFFLHPYVHLDIKKEWAVLYNTLNGKILEYKDQPDVLKVLRRLKKNLYITGLKGKEINAAVRDFINHCRQYFLGDILDKAITKGKPFQAAPMLRLTNNPDELTFKSTLPVVEKDEIGNYLDIIDIYLNDTCSQVCTVCDYGYKQILNCTAASGKKEELSPGVIDTFLQEAQQTTSLYKLNILGGNILHYSNLEQLVQVFSKYNFQLNYYINYLNLQANHGQRVKVLAQAPGTIHVPVNPPVQPDAFTKASALLRDLGMPVVYQFIIETEKDVLSAQEIISVHQLENHEFAPLYTEAGKDFFQNNLFTEKSAIESSKPTRKNIFARMSVNTLSFKKLTVMSNGKVYANLFRSAVGRLGKDSVLAIITGELKRGTVWNKVRRNVSPCKGCPYNALCPPISTYEYAAGRYNLCIIYPP